MQFAILSQKQQINAKLNGNAQNNIFQEIKANINIKINTNCHFIIRINQINGRGHDGKIKLAFGGEESFKIQSNAINLHHHHHHHHSLNSMNTNNASKNQQN